MPETSIVYTHCSDVASKHLLLREIAKFVQALYLYLPAIGQVFRNFLLCCSFPDRAPCLLTMVGQWSDSIDRNWIKNSSPCTLFLHCLTVGCPKGQRKGCSELTRAPFSEYTLNIITCWDIFTTGRRLRQDKALVRSEYNEYQRK